MVLQFSVPLPFSQLISDPLTLVNQLMYEGIVLPS